jgi:hypothetical protein
MTLAWGGHRNGRIPAASLATAVNFRPLPGEPVGPLANCLRADAAHQWAVMVAHALVAGHVITLSEGYRDIIDQRGRWATFQFAGSPLAAEPGTSLHGWGLSADSDTTANGRIWMRANARLFGFSPTGDYFSRPEPWHYDYVLTPVITTFPATEVPQEEVDMRAVHMTESKKDKRGKVMWTAGAKFLISGPTNNGLSKASSRTLTILGLKPMDVNNADMTALCQQLRITDSHMVSLAK